MKKTEMYKLVSCYDTLEMETRGDVLSDKVCLNDNTASDNLLGLRMSRSESILTDMTHVISPMSHNSFQPKSPIPSSGSPPNGTAIQNNSHGPQKQQNGKTGRHVSYSVAEPEEYKIPIDIASNRDLPWPKDSELTFQKDSEPEPYCFPVFRWSLILVGMVMLVCVFVVLVQLLYDWGTGNA